MIFEYALEPELVATWHNRHAYRFFIDKFGLGSCRIVSRYPRHWARMVWEAFRATGDMDRKRMEELLSRLKERMATRPNSNWENAVTWYVNALNEHATAPFRAIIARSNPAELKHVIVDEALADDAPELWIAPQQCVVERTPQCFANTLAPLLKLCRNVIFVDPYFAPERPKYRATFKAFMEALCAGRTGPLPERVEFYSCGDGSTTEFFSSEISRRLHKMIPTGLKIRFARLLEIPGGEKLHNRYILTELGGVGFLTGLDEGNPGHTDDVFVMTRDIYECRWRQYASDTPAFHLAEPPVEIVGK